MITTAGAAQPTGRPLQPQACYASLTRPPYGRPLTPEPLSTLAAGSTAGHGLPPSTRHPSSPELNNPRSTTNPRGTQGPLRFLARTSSITWDRNVKRQVGPDMCSPGGPPFTNAERNGLTRSMERPTSSPRNGIGSTWEGSSPKITGGRPR